mmetsp:Transcript_32987/g.53524  ORF Transcript_32987/g.53524 Transcript_32987/m.53524 type:complete len:325 (-) Transcript_32987:496-1470(-)
MSLLVNIASSVNVLPFPFLHVTVTVPLAARVPSAPFAIWQVPLPFSFVLQAVHIHPTAIRSIGPSQYKWTRVRHKSRRSLPRSEPHLSKPMASKAIQCTRVYRAIRLHFLACRKVVFGPYTRIDPAVCPEVRSLAMPHIVEERTLIPVSINKQQHSHPFPPIGIPLSCVDITGSILHSATHPFSSILHPWPFINIAICIRAHPSTSLAPVVEPWPGIYVSIAITLCSTIAIANISKPIPFIGLTISILAGSIARSHTIVKVAMETLPTDENQTSHPMSVIVFVQLPAISITIGVQNGSLSYPFVILPSSYDLVAIFQSERPFAI